MGEKEKPLPKRPREMEKEMIPFHSMELSRPVEKSIRKQAGLDE